MMKKKEFFNIYDDIGRTVKHQSFEFDGASAQYRYDVILDTDGNVYQIEQHRGYGKSDIWTEEEYELLTCSYEQAVKQIKRYAKNQESKSRITESRFGRYLSEKQNISGGGTIVPGQVPATYKPKADFNFAGYDILDYGCGTGTGKEYIKAHNKEERFAGTKVFNYEPFPKFHVDERQKFIASSNPKKMICCNNVLNVIDDDLTDILTEIKQVAKRADVSEIIFKIYQGDKTGKGKQTGKDKYQRNEKTTNYIPKIRKVFTGWDIDERPFKTYFIRLSKGKLNESFVCESEFPAPKFEGEINKELFSYDAIERAVKKLLRNRYNGSETLEYHEGDYMYSLVFSKHSNLAASNLYVNLVVEKYEDDDWEEVYNKELFYYDLVNDSWDSFRAYEDEYDSPEEEEKAFEERYEDIVSNDIADWIIANTEDLF
jgi:hypothetical protein